MNRTRIYLSARQFPHLQGLSDAQIRDRVRAAMLARPKLIAIMRLRNFVLAFVLMAIAAAMYDPASANLGYTLFVVGAAGIALVLCWNLFWINRVVYRITQSD